MKTSPDDLFNELKRLLFNELRSLNISFIGPEHDLRQLLTDSVKGIRSHFLNAETPEDIIRLKDADSFWDLTPKYRLDMLWVEELFWIANKLAFAIAHASLHKSQIRKVMLHNNDDDLFWYHIDMGVRLASSAWDRIALLMHLIFRLDIPESRVSLPRVLRELPSAIGGIEHDEDFKKLKLFRDTQFSELEAGKGKGARHEGTHIIGPGTRFFFLYLEESGRLDKIPEAHGRDAKLDLLIRHHSYYLEGIEAAAKLISKHWQEACNRIDIPMENSIISRLRSLVLKIISQLRTRT